MNTGPLSTRARLADLTGDVLEIGAGTGANLPHYPAGLRSLTLTEPDAHMRRRLTEASARMSDRPVKVLDAPAVEITYGLERILMARQGVKHFKDIR